MLALRATSVCPKDFSKADYASIIPFFSACSFSVPRSSSAAEHEHALVSVLHKNVNDSIDQFVPTKVSGGKRNKASFDPACYRTMKASKAAFRKFQRTRAPADRVAYKSSRISHRKAITAAKSVHTSRTADRIATSSNCKEWWSRVNQVLEKG